MDQLLKDLKKKYNLKPNLEETGMSIEELEDATVNPVSESTLFDAVVVISLAMGIGYWIAPFLKTYGVVIPAYIGPMFIAAISEI